MRILAWILFSMASFTVAAAPTPAGQWPGKVVVMANGELLGRVEDVAVDFETNSLAYVVVSVGSFLIDQNLIAVHPDALRVSDDEFYLVLHTESLDQAKRFEKSNWPSQPDVLPAPYIKPAAKDEGNSEPGSEAGRIQLPEAVATISNGRRTGTIRPGERSATIEGRPESSATRSAQAEVKPKRWSGESPTLASSEFDRLDEDGNGYLTRREIGPRMREDQSFGDFDFDGNDGIDIFEYQVMTQR